MRKKRSPAHLRPVNCAICGVTFQTRHSQGKYCSEDCTRKGAQGSWNAYTNRNKEDRLNQGRHIYQQNREARMAQIAAYRETPAGHAASKVSDKRMRAKYPEKCAARQAVLIALRKGILTKKPCERCGSAKVHGHHPDYSRPLDVVWLCPTCHRKEHQAMKKRQVIIDNQEEEGLEVTA